MAPTPVSGESRDGTPAPPGERGGRSAAHGTGPTGQPGGAPFRHRLRVRYAECDRQGHVFNSHYFAYFDVVLTELWRAAIGYYDLMTERGVDVVVAEAHARYLRAAHFDDEIDIEAGIERLGTTGITTRFRVLRAESLLVDGRLRHVCVDAAALTSTPIPDWLREGLAPWVVGPPGAGHPAAGHPAPARVDHDAVSGRSPDLP